MTEYSRLASWRLVKSVCVSTFCVVITLGVTVATHPSTAARGALSTVDGQEPTFAVASIKVTTVAAQKKADTALVLPNAGGVIEPPLGGRVLARAATARVLIRYAYGELGSNGAIVRPLEAARVLDGPAWIDDTMFDIDARMDDAGRGPMERAAMMRALLAERFNLRAHREQRDLPVFTLLFARDDHNLGPQIKELTGPCVPTANERDTLPCATRTGPGSITGHGIAIGALATYLSPVVGRAVVDRTGLTGRFDLALQFSPLADVAVPEAKAPFFADAPSVFVAIQQQLGLKLVAGRGPVDVVVIDRMERPSEN